MNNLSIDESLSTLEKKIDALTNLIDQQTQRGPNYFNYNGGHYFQHHHVLSSYYHSGWRTNEDFSYRSQNFQSQEGSSYNYQEQIHQPSNEEMCYALWNEVKKDKATWEANSFGQLAHALEEQYFRTL